MRWRRRWRSKYDPASSTQPDAVADPESNANPNANSVADPDQLQYDRISELELCGRG